MGLRTRNFGVELRVGVVHSRPEFLERSVAVEGRAVLALRIRAKESSREGGYP